MFSVGDLVVHPMHGAGIIDTIVRETVAGHTQEYYVFQMPLVGLLLKIPVANSEAIGIRAALSSEEVETLMQSIPAMEVDSDSNWNKRYRENMQRVKSGDLYEVARVIKALMVRDARRGLSTGERKMLRNARQIFVSEVGMTEKRPYSDVEEQIDHVMLFCEADKRSMGED